MNLLEFYDKVTAMKQENEVCANCLTGWHFTLSNNRLHYEFYNKKQVKDSVLNCALSDLFYCLEAFSFPTEHDSNIVSPECDEK